MAKGNNAAQSNRCNQMNPNHAAYQASRSGTGHSKAALDNRSVQLNVSQTASKPTTALQPAVAQKGPSETIKPTEIVP